MRRCTCKVKDLPRIAVLVACWLLKQRANRCQQLAKLVHEKRRDFISDPAGLTGRVLANQLVNHISQLENYRTLTGEDTELDALLAELIEALQGHAQRLEKRKRKREP